MVKGVQILLSAEQFLLEARNATGIDIEDIGAIESLNVLLKSLNEDSDLHAAGAEAMQSRILRMLCNRLRMKRDFAQHPEIADEIIKPPIVFCGLGRTGSTKTHRLFSSSGDFNFLHYWTALNPSLLTGSRAEPTEPRIQDAVAYTQWYDQVSPELKYGHAFEPFEPEEESVTLEQSLRSGVPVAWTPVAGYLEWLATQDMAAQFAYLRDVFKYLQWQGLASASKRWLMKCPIYTGFEREMLSIFPDAKLVMTHRDPVSVAASGIRLLELFHKAFSDTPPNSESFVAGTAFAVETHLNFRAERPDLKILDIPFRALTGEVEPVIEKTYEFIGQELTEASRRRMLTWNESNPQHKHGKFVYSLSDYDLTEDVVRRSFARYDIFLRENFGELI